ncbi:SDR family NAD(P)-dependent oxidoreductase [Amycolatopsis jejuensis]|uniref:SDR family NAD(P)-dependent oxidoreductase n=1 Tax=Amycolatopsis jejuensis TaxID=330084 RepID=UPI00068D26D1|nr:SDR family oxidoreductase [Amycolatopsis jejuensis]
MVTGRLGGKVAVVVGAAGGIGRSVAATFVREGASVALLDLASAEPADFAATGPGEVISVALDLSDEASVAQAFRTVAETFPAVDILVNCAAIRVPVGDVTRTEASSWQRAFEINLFGSVRSSKYCLPLMTSGRCSIVHVSSIGARRGRPGWAVYDSTKAALIALTRDMACDHVAQGIRVNAICPGPTITPFHVREYARAKDVTVEEAERRILRQGASNLMNRPARAEEIANAILFLAGDESSFITGCVVDADGGAKPSASGFVAPGEEPESHEQKENGAQRLRHP